MTLCDDDEWNMHCPFCDIFLWDGSEWHQDVCPSCLEYIKGVCYWCEMNPCLCQPIFIPRTLQWYGARAIAIDTHRAALSGLTGAQR